MPPDPIRIESIDDPRVEVFREVRDRDLRGRDRLFMAESELVLRRLLRQPERLHAILLAPQRLETLSPLLADLPPHVPLYVADLEVMTGVTGFHIHRGVLAAGVRPTEEELQLDRALGGAKDGGALTMIVAEGLTNVDNMGGLFRNAAAFGAAGVVLDPTCCDPLYRKAIRVSMGHALSVPYAVAHDWPGDLVRLKREWRLTLVGAEADPTARPLWEMPRSERLGLLFGSEGRGLSAGALRCCDAVYQIPMAGAVPSLNVATASAVVLYELTRGRA